MMTSRKTPNSLAMAARALFFALALALLPGVAVAESPLSCFTVPIMIEAALEGHVAYSKVDDALSARVVELYLDRLDPTNTLLTEAEFAAVRKKVEAMLVDVQDGKCESLDALAKEQLAWHQQMETFVKKELAKAEPIDLDLEIAVDPDDRVRTKNDKARDLQRRTFLHLQLANYVSSGVALEEAREKLAARYTRITKRVSERKQADIYGELLDAFVSALDPHSDYFTADDLEDFRISMALSLEGIGAVLTTEDGFTVVRELVPGGAADRAGELAVDDKIIAVAQGTDIDGVPVFEMDLRDVVRMIRGEKGTKVKLTIVRQGTRTETHDIVIVRDKIVLEEQAAQLRWETRAAGDKEVKLAIIELPAFYGGATDPNAAANDMRALLTKATEGGADGVMLDLSRNGGGLLNAAVDIAGLFIAEGPIVSVVGRTAPTEVLSDTDPGLVYAGPLVVLTSRASASASEIVTGALRDYERAVIVGDDHTFGKGSVQTVSSLPAGLGALKVTVAMYYLPEGESTQSAGVVSHIVAPTALNNSKFGEKSQKYSLPAGTTKPFEGAKANPTRGGYIPVKPADVEKLAKASAKRVAASPEFAEVEKAIAEREKRGAMLSIKELLEEDKDDPHKDKDDKKNKDKKALTPQAQEALLVLADWIALGKAR